IHPYWLVPSLVLSRPNNDTGFMAIYTLAMTRPLLAYLNKKTNELNYMRPIRIMSTDHLITKFNPLQACYIGILSGIAKSKSTNHKISSHKNTERFTVINSEQCSIL
ncbi:MAG: hypothetical protein KF702_10760, partial [Gammaproteobacteria bacterium]|nr:hypothetical protein [Gammaproteobacteria bacterium]